IGASSTVMAASGGASAVDCFLPFSIPMCMIDKYGLAGLQTVNLKLNPAGVDNVGWARPDGSVNNSYTSAQIGNCKQSGEIEIGDPVGLGNGVMSSLDNLQAATVSSSTRWSTATWGLEPAPMTGSSL